MIRVILGDALGMGLAQQSEGQVMQVESIGQAQVSPAERIRKVIRRALQTAEERGLTNLLLPVINSGREEIAPEQTACWMVAEVRRHLSLGPSLQEVTFALADPTGVNAFEEVINRKSIVCLGDSITYGYPDGPTYSWVAKVAEATGYQLINRGISGETTGEMLQRFDRDVLEERPAYLIFAGGHNDGWQKVPLEEACGNIQRAAEQALEQGICPLLVLPSPLNEAQMLQSFEGTPAEATTYNHKLQQIRQWIGQYASDQGILTLDFYTPLLDPQTGEGNTHYLLDGGHPTHEGYAILGAAALQQLTGKLHL